MKSKMFQFLWLCVLLSVLLGRDKEVRTCFLSLLNYRVLRMGNMAVFAIISCHKTYQIHDDHGSVFSQRLNLVTNIDLN